MAEHSVEIQNAKHPILVDRLVHFFFSQVQSVSPVRLCFCPETQQQQQQTHILVQFRQYLRFFFFHSVFDVFTIICEHKRTTTEKKTEFVKEKESVVVSVV